VGFGTGTGTGTGAGTGDFGAIRSTPAGSRCGMPRLAGGDFGAWSKRLVPDLGGDTGAAAAMLAGK